MSALPPPPPSGPGYPGGPGSYGNVGPYGNVVRSGQPVQPLDGLAIATQILLGVMAAIGLFGVFAFASRAQVLDDFLNGSNRLAFSDLQDLEDADNVVGVAVAFTLLGALATGIVFVIWQFRHARNAEALGGKHGLGAEWAIAGWFVPCANYALPGVQLFQASKSSDPALPPQASGAQGQGGPLVIFWAIAFGLGTALFSISRVMFPDEDEVALDIDRAQDGVSADNLGAASYLLLVVAAILGIVMVRQLTKRQAARAQALTAAGVLGYGGMPGYGGGPGYAPPPGYGAAAGGAWGQAPAQPGYGPSYGTPSGQGYGAPPAGYGAAPGQGYGAPSGQGYGAPAPGYGSGGPPPQGPGQGQPPGHAQPAPPRPEYGTPQGAPEGQQPGGAAGWGTPPGEQPPRDPDAPPQQQ